MSRAIEQLEVKVAFLEDALNKLSDEHYRQQKELDGLKNQYAVLRERMENSGQGEDSEYSAEDERPPHY
jgi:SlyX protein